MSLDSEFLDAFLLVLGKRGKAIRYRVHALTVERLPDGNSERVAVDCRLLAPRTSLRLHAWPDRWIWVDGRRSSKTGWIWQFTTQGRLAGGLSASDLVAALEEAIGASGSEPDGQAEDLDRLWQPLLARGPRPIRA